MLQQLCRLDDTAAPLPNGHGGTGPVSLTEFMYSSGCRSTSAPRFSCDAQVLWLSSTRTHVGIGDTAADEAANTWCDRRNGLLLRGGGDSPATPTPQVALHDRHAAPGPLFQLAKASGAAQPLGRLENGAGVEYLSCVKVKPDGRCLFRSLVLGLAANKGTVLSSQQEEKEADLLRSACAEALCPSLESRAKYPEAVLSIKAEMTIQEYCKRVVLPTFWGGESELLVLTQLLRQPVTIYLPADGGRSLGYTPLVSYGTQFATTKSGQPRKKVKLLYSNGNHYDLLL